MRHPHETPELRVSLSGLAALGWSTYHPPSARLVSDALQISDPEQ